MTLLGAALVVGSGGGGGNNPTARSELVSITDANAVTIAAEAWFAVGTADTGANLPLLDRDPATVSCDNAPAGSVQVAIDTNAVTFTFNNCFVAADGATYEGTYRLELISVSADGLSFTASLTFNQFTSDDGTTVFTSDGTFTGTTTTTDSGITFDTTITGGLVDWTVNGDSFTMFDFTLVEHEDTGTNSFDNEMSGEIQGAAFGGRVQIQTLTAFTHVGDAFPTAGSAKITGANGSSVTLTALDGTNVRLDIVDETGATFTIDTTWAALTGA